MTVLCLSPQPGPWFQQPQESNRRQASIRTCSHLNQAGAPSPRLISLRVRSDAWRWERFLLNKLETHTDEEEPDVRVHSR